MQFKTSKGKVPLNHKARIIQQYLPLTLPAKTEHDKVSLKKKKLIFLPHPFMKFKVTRQLNHTKNKSATANITNT